MKKLWDKGFEWKEGEVGCMVITQMWIAIFSASSAVTLLLMCDYLDMDIFCKTFVGKFLVSAIALITTVGSLTIALHYARKSKSYE